jgi:hypothetical protein
MLATSGCGIPLSPSLPVPSTSTSSSSASIVPNAATGGSSSPISQPNVAADAVASTLALDGSGSVNNSSAMLANCDCSIFREVASLLLFGKRAELQANVGSQVVLSMLTGELLAATANEVLTTTTSAGEMMFADSPRPHSHLHSASMDGTHTPLHVPLQVPITPMLLTPALVSEVESLLWAVVLAPSPLFCSCPAPSRAATAYCLRYYRKILGGVKWKVQSLHQRDSDFNNNKTTSSTVGGLFSFGSKSMTQPTSAPQQQQASAEPDIDEVFSVIHLLGVICRAILLGYIAIGKQQSKASPVSNAMHSSSGEAVYTFSQLFNALTPRTKSDVANLLLEAASHCNRLFRRRYNRLWLSPGDDRVAEDQVAGKLASQWVQRSTHDHHPVVYEFLDRYMRVPVPVFPTMVLFDEISSSLPMPASVAQTLTSIFSNT